MVNCKVRGIPYAAVPSTMIAKTAWMMRRARTMVLFS